MNDNRITFFLHPIVLMMTLGAALPAVSVALLLQQSFTVVLSVGLAAAVFGLLWGTLTYNLSYGRLDRMLSAYIDALAKVAEGDLTMQIDTPPISLSTREGAIARRLTQVTNQMIERLRGVVADFYSAFQRLETDTQAILEATARQINMANEQDAVVTETTATVNEVRATVTETAERAQSVAETANLSVTISRGGIEAVAETIEGMDLIRRRVEDIADNILVLSEHTQQIGEIISTVNALADQSRMLALNASVEAARAGEEGKGFAWWRWRCATLPTKTAMRRCRCARSSARFSAPPTAR